MFVFVLPVKSLDTGKSRLQAPRDRAELIRAMLLTPWMRSSECDLGPVVVVSPDSEVKDLAARNGARAMHHGAASTKRWPRPVKVPPRRFCGPACCASR